VAHGISVALGLAFGTFGLTSLNACPFNFPSQIINLQSHKILIGCKG
jgi:hypothetical protein